MKLLLKLSSFLLIAVLVMGANVETKKTHILILGDSLTDGFGVDRENSWPSLLGEKLKADYQNFRITNGGVTGATTSSGVSRIKWYNLKDKPDILILALGSNDGLRGIMPGESRKNLQKIIDYCSLNQIKVLLTGQKIPPNYGKEYALEFEEIFETLARRNRVKFYPFLLSGVAGDNGLNQADGIHPNEEGYEIMAEKIHEFWLDNLSGWLEARSDI